MNRAGRCLLCAGMDKDEFEALLPEARRENAQRLKIFSLFAAGVFAVMAAAGLTSRSAVSVNMTFYILMLLFNGALYLCARFALPARPGLTPVMAYSFVFALALFSLGLSALHTDHPAVTAIAVMLVAPFLFTDRPVYLAATTLLHVALHWALGFALKPSDVAALDFWNGLSFGLVAVVIGYFQNKGRFRLLAQTHHIRYLSETDLLTGAKNRNCYESRQRDYARDCERGVTCVYADVNGLHELNNARGHAAGDEMLKAVAAALIRGFGAENTYRIGGDEFVVFLADADEAAVERDVKRIAGALSGRGYHVSVGIETGEKAGLSMPVLTSRAEEAMYRDKRNYYRQAEHDRRRQ